MPVIDPLSMCNLKGHVRAAVQLTATDGTITTTYNVSQANVPFGFRQLSSSEAVRFDRESVRRIQGAIMLPTADISEKDKFSFGSRLFDVQGVEKVYDDQTGLVGYLSVVLEETV